MKLVDCQNVYTHCAVNCYPHCLDHKNELICFATVNSIALYDLKKRKIVALCNQHKNTVNSVRWIGKEDKYFISSSVDKTCIIWQNISEYLYEPKFTLSAHTDSVIVSDSVYYQTNETFFLSVSSSNDQILRFWKDDTLLHFKNVNSFVFDIKLYDNLTIPGLVVLTTGSNELVNVNRFNVENNQFECLISLKGHGDWIKSLDLFQLDDDTLMLASGSQDFLIRVYSIKLSREDVNLHQQLFELTTEKGINLKFVVNLETVLSGHEGWVTEVKWHFSEKLYLLSSSMDKTIILWEQMEDIDSIWNEKIRFGEVGGNAIGFIGCSSVPSIGLIVGYSFNGAVNFWQHTDESNQWQTSFPITGHFNEVTDLVWDQEGEFFLTCSTDQTTRLHSYWKHDGDITWHEIGRPQVHGYDLKCIAMAGGLRFVSGADEKVIRIFNATKYFIESLRQISCNEQFVNLEESGDQVAECAIVPALGLSNSAVYDSSQIGEEFKPKVLSTPPTEEILLQNTLWPETQKLYGHGYEIFALAVNRKCTLLASACKAANVNHAAIILWDLTSYKMLAHLPSHNLTVTQIRFSPDDRYLLSVSRDRTWALFDMNSPEYCRIAFSDKKTGIHSRIIWDCAWTPDSKAFLTAARDKTVVIWVLADQQVENSLQVKSSQVLTLEDSVTSVDVHYKFSPTYLSCLALDNGKLLLYSFTVTGEWSLLYNFPHHRHTHTINKVRFSSKVETDNQDKQLVLMASCSSDRSVKLFKIGLTL